MEGKGHHLRRVELRDAGEDGTREATGSTGAPDADDAPEPGAHGASREADARAVGLVAALAGAIGLAIAALEGLLRTAAGTEPRTERSDAFESALSLMAAAGAGLTLAAARGTAIAIRSATDATRPAASFFVEHTLLGIPLRAGLGWLSDWAEVGRHEQAERERTAAALIDAMISPIAAAVIERIDLDDVVRRVDIQDVIDRADVNGIIAKADLDQIIARLDIDGIVARVDIGRIIDRIDIDAIAARIDIGAIIDRVDINAIADRVDIQEILNRVDLAAVTREVMDEVDMGEIIRESTGSITTETIDAVRYQGMNADRFVAKVVDRILQRKASREEMEPVPVGVDAGPVSVTTPGPEDAAEAGAHDRT